MADEHRTWYCGQCLTTFHGAIGSCPNLSCRSPRPDDGWGQIHEEGEVIDRHYRVLKRLATGGAGVTYLARELGADDRELPEDLAVKILWTNRDQGSYLRRLAQEAQILQQLDHPHIVVYKGFVHRSGSSPYLVTRFERGGSLHEYVLERGSLAPQRAASVVRQVLEALDRAHQAGVIHRDLKPENVLLEAIPPDGTSPTVRVADFGVAKVAGRLSDSLTRVGAFVGTPQYAAPEQFEGLPPSDSTDVFAAGALLYFCLHGSSLVPMAHRLAPDEARELLLQKLPPKISARGDDDLLAQLAQVLAGAMAPLPEARVKVREMARMLQAVEDGKPLPRQSNTAVPQTLQEDGSTNIFLFEGQEKGLEEPPADTPPPLPPAYSLPSEPPADVVEPTEPMRPQAPPSPEPPADVVEPTEPMRPQAPPPYPGAQEIGEPIPLRRSRLPMVLAGLALLAFGAVLLAGGGVWWYRPTLAANLGLPPLQELVSASGLPALHGEAPPTLISAASTDPTHKAIHDYVTTKAGLSMWMRDCQVRQPLYFDLLLDAEGAVTGGQASEGSTPELSSCLLARAQATTFYEPGHGPGGSIKIRLLLDPPAPKPKKKRPSVKR